jgi:threonine/homoserine/homoserine lactone efflux protein
MLAVVDTHLLLTFTMTAAVIIAVPGPSAMFVIGRAMSVARPAALSAAAGNTLGIVFQGLLAALGLGSVISGSPLLYNVVKFGGALYLIFMGVKTLRHREFPTATSELPGAEGRGRNLLQGFTVGVTNPKIIVFFAAALPQFVDPTKGYVLVQMLVLLSIFGAMQLFSDTSWTMAGGSMRRWSATSPRRFERLIGGGGVCIIGVGLALALSNGVA